jgi:hypothetical protein
MATALAAGIGCGGSIKGGGPGPGGSTQQPGACASLGECDCYAAGNRCTMLTESCWCPSVCDSKIACVCGGGKFLGCEDSTGTTNCDTQLARVQNLCANHPFLNDLSNVCASNPTCIGGCLSQLTTVDSCAQIDCSFCTACDCSSPSPPSQLSTCIAGCTAPPPPLR